MNVPLARDESARLGALYSLDVLGTGREPEYDAIVRLAAEMFACPIAVISFVDANHQWFKARHGIDAEYGPREIAFCAHAILQDDCLVIPDAARDARFRDNPQVVGEPGLRFYAGYPFSLDGRHNLGTVAVADVVPRTFGPDQVRWLGHLAKAVEGLLKAQESRLRAEEAARRAEEQARAAETKARLLRQIEQMARIGAWRVDLDSREVTWSEQVFALHDLPVGTPPSLDEALGCFPDHERNRILQTLPKALHETGRIQFEGDFVSFAGRQRRMRFSAEIDDAVAGRRQLIGVMQDITDQHEAQRQLWQAAHVDPLSGLANRTWFQQALAGAFEAALGAQTGAPRDLALLLLDLDGFKDINDSFGHQAGDAVIRETAARLRSEFGQDAFCARLGGDEFAVLMPAAGEGQDLLARAEAVLARLRAPILFQEEVLHVAGSIGIARAPADADTPDALLRCADIALYTVKRSGRGAAGVFCPEYSSVFDARRQAIDTVRAALRTDRVVAHYQPLICLHSGAYVGAEALVRLQTGDGGLLGPEQFWPAFADPECVRQLDEAVFERVLSDLAGWQAAGIETGVVSLNASRFWFQTKGFARRFVDALAARGIPAESLCVEVTESVLLNEDSRSVARALSILSEAGVSIALDDFGTGFASLTHLRDFPIDSIKIDRSFISGLGAKPENTVVVKAIVDLSRSLGMNTVAEGVETGAASEFLSAIGCSHAQGFLYARPMAPHAFAAHVSVSRAEMPLNWSI
ncbi:putative bifunctional diguanylate cyclase/phosphodiesterase [Polymorphum gilvum]|uniref:Diguanylate cyclase/phosphodiesterase with PAS/PAC and GAF sensor(S) n=1 Tax=Polymorphum gilvum (strain LMG 25793 / CGMCC 1.9160 / SL003B-26A1) TaxID=991905 RepID=F2IW91_POLGS|nr:EAL domain-containing protein [Polymorphum gilvum]ADZ71476.1 Diguanylate cyclase/phosphodiesterase with PAS/PAC and GAF sensor(S) [Polymorphum gilvum SL003B-26A1]